MYLDADRLCQALLLLQRFLQLHPNSPNLAHRPRHFHLLYPLTVIQVCILFCMHPILFSFFRHFRFCCACRIGLPTMYDFFFDNVRESPSSPVISLLIDPALSPDDSNDGRDPSTGQRALFRRVSCQHQALTNWTCVTSTFWLHQLIWFRLKVL